MPLKATFVMMQLPPVSGHNPYVTTTKRPETVNVRGVSLRTILPASGAVLGVTMLVAAGLAVVLLCAPEPRDVLPEVLALTLLTHSLGCLIALCAVVNTAKVDLRSLGVRRPSWRLLHLLWQIPATIAMAVAAQALFTAAIGGGREAPGVSRLDTAIVGAQPAVLTVAILAIAVLTPLWEELYFRGLLQAGAAQRWGTPVAIIATAVAFAAVHGYLVLLPYYLVLGAALSCLRAFHRSLWGPLALHMTVNGIASSVLLTSLT